MSSRAVFLGGPTGLSAYEDELIYQVCQLYPFAAHIWDLAFLTSGQGAAWLDREAPGWITRIDTRQLDCGHYRRNIFAHVFGDWFAGVAICEVKKLDYWKRVAYGFEPPETCHQAYIDQLTAAWKLRIEQRKMS